MARYIYGRSIEERFWARVDRGSDEKCWLWTGHLDRCGYGTMSVRGKLCVAHRAAYELLVGQVPSGLELDHLCSNPSCVNPAHLQPVTHLENMRRGKHATKTHCKHGHEFTPENTYLNRLGHRWCRACNRAAVLAHKRSKQA